MDTVRILTAGDDLSDAFAIREKVFVDEQGFDLALEIDEKDKLARHAVLYRDGEAVATGRTFPKADEPGTWVIGRVAVLQVHRGGTGARLMEELEQEAARQGATRIVLGAQCRVRGFYEKIGYTAFGEEFLEEGCPHIFMDKSVDSSQSV